jgi:hypothetical protein
MLYFKLVSGIALIAVFGWLLVRNSKRSTLLSALLSIDIILGLIAGLYLIFSSIALLIA